MLNSKVENIKRKNILKNIDNGNSPSILELGMYNLTPYYVDKFNVSLFEAIMLNKNLERGVKHLNDKIYFSPPQQNALKFILENNKIILSAPTSFGKTLIVKEFIFRNKPKNVVYIVPTNALAYELERSFKTNENYNEYIIFDRLKSKVNIDFEDSNDDKLLFIGTQEKFLEIDNKVFGHIDLFVIDEAYKLQESIKKQRGYKLSETFLRSIDSNSSKIILITPQAKFKGFDNFDFRTFESDFNAVEKNFIVLSVEEFYNKFIESLKEKSILFCENPNQINKVYEHLERKLKDTEYKKDYIKQIESDIHPEWSVVKLLKKGILTHHGQMPKYIQNKMIRLFNEDSNYRQLLGTNSISEGINTSTKNLFIHPEYHKIKNRLLLIKNTVGRAGRLGEYPIGYVFSVENIENLLEEEVLVELSVTKEEELKEIEESKDSNKIKELSEKFYLSSEFCEKLLKIHKISLSNLRLVLKILQKDILYDSISNLPFMAKKVFSKEYYSIVADDSILIKGYLNRYYVDEDGNKNYLNTYDDMINYYIKMKKRKKPFNVDDFTKSRIINLYMKFIYSTLEYYIFPIVNIGLEIKEAYKDWQFGKNVIESLEKCKSRYNKKVFGKLSIDNLTESHLKIVSVFKDYGLFSSLKKINASILNEIESILNIRYSTIDVINAISYLSKNSIENKQFFIDITNKL